MKHFFRFATLLLLAALTSIEVSAQDRIRPIPVTQKTFEVGTDYYIYNVGRGMFSNKGEAWGTQATLGYQGMKYQVRHDDDMPEGFYYLWSEETGRDSKVMFRTNSDGQAGSGVCATFVDNNKGPNAYWTIKPFNDNVTGGFIIQIPENNEGGGHPYVATQAWGAQWDHWGKFFDSNAITNGIFFDVEIAENPDNVTWQFVTVDDYETYQDGLDTEAIDAWNAATDLKAWIDLAKQRGADVSAAEELYNNTASTAADMRAELANLKPFVEAQKAAVKLQEAIDAAAEYGVDATEAQAVLNDADATAAEINEATDKLNADIKVAKTAKVLAGATSSEPVDLFAENIFENATFTDNISGWSSTTNVQNKAHKSPNASEQVSCGVDGKNAEGKFYENWDPSASKAVGKMYQKQSKLPEGLYVGKLSVFVNNLSNNNSGENPEQFAYLNDVKAPLTSGPFKSYTMFLQQAEEGDIELGFEQTVEKANWLGIDNAGLVYYGKGEDNYNGLAAALVGDDWEAEFVDEEGNWPIHTAVEREAVSNAILAGANAGSPEAGIEAANNALAAVEGLRTNINLWKELDKTVYGNGNDIIGMYDQQYNLQIDGWEGEGAFRSLLDELAEKLDEIMDDPSKATWTNAELQKKLDRLNQLYDEALEYHAENALNVGDDLTDRTKFGEKYLLNPDFQSEKGALDGWTSTGTNPSFFGGYPDVLECWNANFNISQEVKLPRDGAYRLQTRAFYRTGNMANAYARWIEYNGKNEGDNKSCAFLYAGNLTSPIANVMNTIYTLEEVEAIGAFYDVQRLQTGNNGSQFTTSNNLNPWESPYDFLQMNGEDAYTPNGVYSASYVFNCYKGHEKTGTLEDLAQKYTSFIDFIGEKGEVVRMGVKAENILSEGWTIFAPYHLYYKGNDPAVMKPVMEETINLAKELANEAMTADSLKALNAAITAADGAETGEQLMAAYKSINAAFGPAKNSANTYKTLADANKDLEQTLADRADKASEAAIAGANSEIALVKDILKNGSLADADVPAEIEKIKAVKRELFRPIPGVYPADYTEFALKNPRFQESWTGWERTNTSNTSIENQNVLVNGDTQSWGIAEGWNNAEFGFDIYQIVTDLPEGVWEVRAQGLARLTDNPGNITRGFGTQNPDEIAGLYEVYADSIAKLYANNDAVFLANPYLVPAAANNIEIMKDNNGGVGGWYEMVDEATDPDNPVSYQIPNNRQALASRLGVDWYDADGNIDPEGKWYENVVVTYVDESGELKLGWGCPTLKANAWAPATNFRIIYYGPDDPRKENTGIREITATQTVERTIFSADGRRLNGLTKGLNIIKSKTADGKTVIHKVVIK